MYHMPWKYYKQSKNKKAKASRSTDKSADRNTSDKLYRTLIWLIRMQENVLPKQVALLAEIPKILCEMCMS
jgi:hypothetical protein